MSISEKAVARTLDFDETYTQRGDGQREVNGWEAPNGFGLWYRIDQYFGSDSLGFKVECDHTPIGDFDDIDAAKQCAQAHFEQQIRAALNPTLPLHDGWQPIETAPKDGTDILAYAPKAPDPKIRTTWWRRPEDGKGYIGWGEFNMNYWPPTHWRAIDPPPVIIAEDHQK